MKFTIRQDCRLCAAPLDEPFLRFDSLPVAGVYLREHELGQETRAPLSVHQCPSCSLVQLSEEVSDEIYREYMFSGAHSSRYRSHIERTAGIAVSLNIPKGSLVVEAGSNDGTFVRLMGQHGYRATGFEPARTFDQDGMSACNGRIRFINDYFSQASLTTHAVSGASLFVARHVLEHVADPDAFVSAIRQALVPGGWVILEVPDALSMCREGVVTNLFHEHLVYFTAATLTALLTRHGFSLVRSDWTDAHCGSIVAVFREGTNSEAGQVDLRLTDRITPAAWTAFAVRARGYLERFSAMLASLRLKGAVSGYGAAQRTTTLIGMAGLGEGAFDYFVDKNERYHGRYLPGVHRRVHPPGRLLEDLPLHTVILARAFEAEIIKENAEYLRRGGVFVSTRDAAFLKKPEA